MTKYEQRKQDALRLADLIVIMIEGAAPAHVWVHVQAHHKDMLASGIELALANAEGRAVEP